MNDDDEFCFEIDYVSNTEKSTQFRSGKQAVKTKTKAIQVGTKAKTHSLPFIYFNDRHFLAFCGVDRNFAAFLLSQVGTEVKHGRILKRDSKIFLMLTKLKLNTNCAVLGAMFCVSDCQASVVFRDNLIAVHAVVKDFIIWFDRRIIKARMPASFKALYPVPRAIIDCTQITRRDSLTSF